MKKPIKNLISVKMRQKGETMQKSIFLLLTVVLFSGCGLANSYYHVRNYEKNRVQTSNIGSEMTSTSTIFKNDVYGTVMRRTVQSLTYSGRQGDIIKIHYREFSDGYARPAFTQEITYDLSESDVIVFRDTKIRVLDANNSGITFLVFESPAFEFESGQRLVPHQ